MDVAEPCSRTVAPGVHPKIAKRLDDGTGMISGSSGDGESIVATSRGLAARGAESRI